MRSAFAVGEGAIADPKNRRKRLLVAVLCGLFAALLLVEGTPLYRWSAYHPPVLTNLGFHVQFKRADWLPGEAAIIPSQPCPACQCGEREKCFSSAEMYSFYQPSSFVLNPATPAVGVPTISSLASRVGAFTPELVYRVQEFGRRPAGERGTIYLALKGPFELDGVEIRGAGFSFPGLDFEVGDFDCEP